MQISRKDFLKKFMALAAAGTMRLTSAPPVDIADDPEPELPEQSDVCKECTLPPWGCDYFFYSCPNSITKIVSPDPYNPGRFIVVGEVMNFDSWGDD